MINADLPEDDISVNDVLETHVHCFACGSSSAGLGLQFYPDHSGGLKGEFIVSRDFQGYNGLLHGGIASTILDSVMTHCLMQQGIKGLTAELNIKYHKPIPLGTTVSIYGKVDNKRRKIYFLSAYLETDDGICVSASGKFIEPKS